VVDVLYVITALRDRITDCSLLLSVRLSVPRLSVTRALERRSDRQRLNLALRETRQPVLESKVKSLSRRQYRCLGMDNINADKLIAAKVKQCKVNLAICLAL